MKIFEIILLGVVFLLTILNFNYSQLALGFFFIALFYLVGSYWLFNLKEEKRFIIPVLAGLVLSPAIFSLPYHIALNHLKVYDYLPVGNLVFLSIFTAYYFIKRKTNSFKKVDQRILVRSFIVAFLTAFFAYSPADFSPYNKAVLFLSKNSAMVGKQKMNYYTAKYKDAEKEDDCKQALTYAIKANQGAKVMMAYPKMRQRGSLYKLDKALKAIDKGSVNFPSKVKDLHKTVSQEKTRKIGGTYKNLYEAYKCRGKELNERGSYRKALRHFEQAHQIIEIWQPKHDSWKVKKAYLLNYMGDSHKKLQNQEIADSFYVEAIALCKENQKSAKADLAYLHTNRAKYLESNAYYGLAVKHLEKAEKLHKQLGQSLAFTEHEISKFNTFLARCYIQNKSFQKAIDLIQETYHLPQKHQKEYCRLNNYYGIAWFRQNRFKKADSFLNIALDCGRSNNNIEQSSLLTNIVYLAKIKLALAEYDSARKYVDWGLKAANNLTGYREPISAEILRISARLYYQKGKYQSAKKHYHQALAKLEGFKGGSPKVRFLPFLLADLAYLYTKLGEIEKAKIYADSGLSMGIRSQQIKNVGGNQIINTSAYFHYFTKKQSLADSLYNWSLKLADSHGISLNHTRANALNGLGLVNMDKGQYQKADSLFRQSLKLSRQLFSKNHPEIARVLVNLGELKIKQGQLNLAKSLLERSKGITSEFFNKDHDAFGEIYATMGDLAFRQNQMQKAQSCYQKALSIYLINFERQHYRVKEVKASLKRIQNKKL